MKFLTKSATKPFKKPWSLVGLLLTNAVFANPAFSQETLAQNKIAEDKKIALDEVVVSADFRPQTAQSTAVSLTEIDSETIQARSAQHLEEILNLAPNVNFSSGASRGQFIQIRGIGERSQFSAPLNPSVGLVIDGVDFSRTGGAATLFDIDSIEILRGPQGTKFGTNGLAGTINMRSKEPTKEFSMHAQTSLAEYNTRNFGAAVGGTLLEDKLLGRASIYTHKSNGYMDNDFLNRDNTQNQDELTFRGKLKLLATDNLTVDLSYTHLNIDNGYDAFTLDNSRNSLSDNPGEDKQRTNAFAVKANWQASDAVIIQTEATYLRSDLLYSFDEDWGFVGQFDASLDPYDSFDSYDRKRENHSFELRALSDKTGRIFNDSTDWTIGFYHINQDEDFERIYTFGNNDGKYNTKNSSIYGQLDTHITDKLTLTTGARVEYFKARYSNSNALKINQDEGLFGGKIGLNYQANQNHLIYTTLSRGYKSGGVNNDASLSQISQSQLTFDTEYNVTFEAGLKSSWLDQRLKTALAAFYTDRRNAQVENSIAIGTSFIEFIGNASNATHQGVEASLDWFVTDKVRLMGALGLLDARFDNHSVGGENFDGRQVAHAPNYTFNLGSEFYVNDAWTIRANVEGKDDFYFSDSHNAKSDAYAIVNASADYKHDKHWKVRVWARNLLDKDYATRGFFFGNNPAKGYVDEAYRQLAEPRVAGLTVSYDY